MSHSSTALGNALQSAEPTHKIHPLNLPKETLYFRFALLISIVVWLALIVSIIGILYAAMFCLFAWLANGILTARLRAEAVKVDDNQFTALDATLTRVCSRLGQTIKPELYILESSGLLNAFATRFAGRNFVVVYSDILDAFGPDSPEMEFLLGHEIGHIRSNHIRKWILLTPGLFMPLLGAAYQRACEASCDRYGAQASSDLSGAIRAMLTLAAGRGHGAHLNPTQFAAQHIDDRGFFVSLHELISGYPTLSQRVLNLLALARPSERPPAAPRNIMAYFVALFIPSSRMAGGAASALVIMVMIGLVASMSIPAFAKVRQNSQALQCANNRNLIAAAVQDYALQNGQLPAALDDLTTDGQELPICPTAGQYMLYAQSENEFEVICSEHGPFGKATEAQVEPSVQYDQR